jgi:AcrR family transcriptional regulator
MRMLEAALGVLADHGIAGYTMEAIARRAGASKATLYRHWPSAGALLIDAMDTTFQPLPAPQTGSLRSDLTALLDRFVHVLTETPFPRLMAAFIDAAERDPTLSKLHADLTHRRRQPMLEVLDQARQRGEIPATTDAELVVDLLTSPFFYNRFIAHRPLPPQLAAKVVDHVLAAITANGPAHAEQPRG